MELVLLACSSSLDNFVVGLSLGANKSVKPHQLNAIVAAANATGAALSASVGVFLGSLVPQCASLGAAGVFLWLAFGEASSAYRGERSSLTDLALKGNSWRVALPMTLNNLAAGVAGGVARLPPLRMGFAAFFASFCLMDLGYRLGACIGNDTRVDPRIIAALAFSFLGLSQLLDGDLFPYAPLITTYRR